MSRAVEPAGRPGRSTLRTAARHCPRDPVRRVRSSRAWWAWLLCSLTGTALMALPDPDRRLFSISETHGPGVLDMIGALVLTAGWTVIYAQIWRGRRRLLAVRRSRLLALVLVALIGAFIVAFSVRRDAGMWWLPGALVLAAAQVVAAVIASDELEGVSSGVARRPGAPASQPSSAVPGPSRQGHQEDGPPSADVSW